MNKSLKYLIYYFIVVGTLSIATACTAPDREDPRQDSANSAPGGNNGGGGGGGGTTTNSPPVANNVQILPTATVYEVGQALQGSYEYFDVDGDSESGAGSSFRWLRDGNAIANQTTKEYFLSSDDVGTKISFEVTPIAASGVTVGLPISSTVDILIPLTTVVLLDSNFDQPIAVKEFAATLRAKMYNANMVVISDPQLICTNLGANVDTCLPGSQVSNFKAINYSIVGGQVFNALLTVLKNDASAIPLLDKNSNPIETHIIAITDGDASLTATSFSNSLAALPIPLNNLANAKFHAIVADGLTACPNSTTPATATNIIEYAKLRAGVLRNYCLHDYPGDLDEIANDIKSPGGGKSNIN